MLFIDGQKFERASEIREELDVDFPINTWGDDAHVAVRASFGVDSEDAQESFDFWHALSLGRLEPFLVRQ